MSLALRQNTPAPEALHCVSAAPTALRPPFDRLSPEEELRHFQCRAAVRYFPVPDEEQASRGKADGILAGEIELNGERHLLPSPMDWLHNPSRDREWLILLHKFYFGVALAQLYVETGDPRCAARWVELVDSWIDQVPLDFLPGDVAGRRLQSWIGAHRGFVVERPSPAITPRFHRKLLHSVRDQVVHLIAHLASARNHRTIELMAVFQAAVVFPELREAAEWLRFSVAQLERNVQDDFLPDGVHCELSTDYHCLVLKNFLNAARLARLNGVDLPANIHAGIRKALRFAQHVHRPDGCIPALSDSDSRSFLGLLAQGASLYPDAPEAAELLYSATRGRHGRAPSERAVHFADSGYAIVRSGWGAGTTPVTHEQFLVLDAGPFGAGNHGHFDALSFELAAFGVPLVVDPGRYTYDESGEINWRASFRVSRAHNTVVVDGMNQAPYEPPRASPGGKLRLRGPAAEASLLDFSSGLDIDFLRARVVGSGYSATHERRIVFVHRHGRKAYWVVSDLLWADEQHDYDLYFHLTDAAQGQLKVQTQGETAIVIAPHLVLVSALASANRLTVEAGFVSRTYGVKHEAPVVRISRRGGTVAFHTLLVPFEAAEIDAAPQAAITAHSTSWGGIELRMSMQLENGLAQDVLRYSSAGQPQLYAS